MKKLALIFALVVGFGSPAFSQNVTYHDFVKTSPAAGPVTESDLIAIVQNNLTYKVTPSTLVQAGMTSVPSLPIKTTFSPVISGSQPDNSFVDGMAINANTSGAISKTDIGKVNAFGAYNTFGSPSGSPLAGEAQRIGLWGVIKQLGPTAWTQSDSVRFAYNTGLWGYVTVAQGNTGPGQFPNYTGVAGLTEIGGTGTQVNNLMGAEFDVVAGPSVVVGNRMGVYAVAGSGTFPGTMQGSSFDAAYAIGSDGGANWNMGYALRGPSSPFQPWPYTAHATMIGGLGPGGGGPAGVGIDFTGITFADAEYRSDHVIFGPVGGYFQTGDFPLLQLKNTLVSGGVASNAGGLTRWIGLPGGAWCMQINTAVAEDYSTAINSYCMTAVGQLGFNAGYKPGSRTFAAGPNQLPTCNSASQDLTYAITDAAVPTFNAPLTGGGAARVLGRCNGAGQWLAGG